jgi:hypothetical protein
MGREAFRSAVQLHRLSCEFGSFFLGIMNSPHQNLTHCKHMQVVVPRLMKALDLRLIVFAGALIFGGSCFLSF